MKAKCFKFECEQCVIPSTIQVFYRQTGEIASGRARHYKGRVNGKPQFDYHPLSIEYIKRKLRELGIENNGLGLVGLENIKGSTKNDDDTQKNESSPFTKNNNKNSLVKWTGGDLNPRPLECKSSVHTN
jgi:hypothetical protein